MAPKVIAITAKIDSACISCDELVRAGDSVWWTPGVGVWHRNCDKPKSLDMLWREAQGRRRLGLNKPRQFGEEMDD